MVDLANPNLADPDLADPNLAGGFVPTDLDGAVLWLRPDSSHVTLNGSDVSGITDRSSAGNNASQGTASAQPLWNSSDSDFNGHPSFTTDGASEFLVADDLASVASGTDQPVTVSIVYKNNDLTVNVAPWSLGLSSSDNPQLWQYDLGGVDDSVRVRKVDDAVNIADARTTDTIDTTPRIITMTHTGTTATIYDGKTPMAGADGVAMDVGATTLDQFTIGCLRRTSNSLFFDGKFADIIAYNRALTSDEVSQIVDYAGRYGL